MNFLNTLLFLLIGVSSNAQFFIESGAEVYVKPNVTLYLVENLENKGTLTLEPDGTTEVIFDGNYNNTDGIVAFNDNAFRIGSGSANSTSNVNLDFKTGGETVERMIVNKTGGTATGVSSFIEITQSLTMDAGNLDAEDQVILISSATNTAVVEDSDPNATAKVTVQRYFPARRAFRFVSPSVNSSGTIHDHWQEGATAWDDTSVENNFGTHITGNNTSQTDNSLNNGLDWNPSGNTSMFEFTNTWVPVLSTDNIISDKLLALKPYRIMIRGARVDGGIAFNINLNSTPATNTSLRAKGDLIFGNQTATLNTGADAFSLVANPYHSQVDFKALAQSNLTTFVYYWDPTVNTRGGYVSFDTATNGVSIETAPGTGTTEINQYIQPGQAFFVQNTAAGNGSLSFAESNKNNSNPQTEVFNETVLSALNITLKTDVDSELILADGIKTVFGSNYSSQATEEDAPRFTNTDETLGLVQDSSILMFDKRPIPVNEQIIPLSITQYRNINYQFSITKENLAVDIALEDIYTGEIMLVDQDFTYDFTIDENISESVDENRFNLIYNPTTLSVNDNSLAEMSLSPNPTSSLLKFQFSSNLKTIQSTVNIFDITGRLVSSYNLDDTLSIDVSSLSDGVYIAKVSNDVSAWSVKFIKK